MFCILEYRKYFLTQYSCKKIIKMGIYFLTIPNCRKYIFSFHFSFTFPIYFSVIFRINNTISFNSSDDKFIHITCKIIQKIRWISSSIIKIYRVFKKRIICEFSNIFFTYFFGISSGCCIGYMFFITFFWLVFYFILQINWWFFYKKNRKI